MPIIRELDKRVRRDFHNEKVYIIDEQERVHMAHIDIHYGQSVNGVAALHTQILEESELKPFYDIYPENSIIRRTASHSADGCCTATMSWLPILRS